MEHEKLTERIIECAIKIHKTIGPGFLESIYQNALPIEFKNAGLLFEPQKEISIYYNNILVGTHRLDFLVENTVIVELKCVKEFDDFHLAQVISYLKAAKLKVGLLLNFSKEVLKIKRVVN